MEFNKVSVCRVGWVYMSGQSMGITMEGIAFTGCEITQGYDNILLQIIVRGQDFSDASSKIRRALKEFIKEMVGMGQRCLQYEALRTGIASGGVKMKPYIRIDTRH